MVIVNRERVRRSPSLLMKDFALDLVTIIDLSRNVLLFFFRIILQWHGA